MRNYLPWRPGTFDLVPFYLHGSMARAVYYRDLGLITRLLGSYQIYESGRSGLDSALCPFFTGVATDKGVVICIEGTTDVLQWFYHAAGALQIAVEGFPGKVHSFWVSVANHIYQRIKDFLEAATVGPIYINGHSYGGGLAALVAYLVYRDFPERKGGVITFGQPRVGDSVAAAGVSWPVVRIRNEDDPVCTIPPERASVWLPIGEQSIANGILHYAHQGEEWIVNDDANIALGGSGQVNWRDPQVWTVEVQQRGGLNFSDHFMNAYMYRIRKRIHNATGLDWDSRAMVAFCDIINKDLNDREGSKWPWI